MDRYYQNDTTIKSYPCKVLSEGEHTVLLKTEDELTFRIPKAVFDDLIIKKNKRFIYSIKQRENKTLYHYIELDSQYKELNEKIDKQKEDDGNWFINMIQWLLGK